MSQNLDVSQDELLRVLGKATPIPWMGRKRTLIGVLALGLIGTLAWSLGSGNEPAGRFVTEEAKVSDLVVTASASGTLQPTKSVDVGSELSGTLASVFVQENDRVKKGQLLAELDTAKLKDAVARSAATVAAAEAKVAQAKASLAEAKALRSRLQQVFELSAGKVPAQTELEAAEAAAQRALASEASAQAEVVQARAALKTDQTNLARATIRSPVDGVVLSRKVEPGNTVVAAMNTPVLFVIAEDLTRMELQVKVDEADVASVKPDQSATFSVAAWPGRQFPATIQRVGLGATTSDNVVTYKTILKVANDDLALRPGMTATAAIVTAKRDQALVVPNAALRFTPPAAAGQKPNGSFVSSLLPRPPEEPKRRAASAGGSEQQLWVLIEKRLQPVAVTTGASDGRYTEIVGGNLKPGVAVVTDYQEAKP